MIKDDTESGRPNLVLNYSRSWSASCQRTDFPLGQSNSLTQQLLGQADSSRWNAYFLTRVKRPHTSCVKLSAFPSAPMLNVMLVGSCVAPGN
jgi:hypothetical protein